MARRELIARNLAIAEKYYDGYHRSVERGRLTQAFDPDDFAKEWIFASPFLGGETVQGRDSALADGAVANHAFISQQMPDYQMDHFRAWPTEAGCAWRWCVNGHGLDGRYRDFWEQLFLWTDDDAKITRFEFYDDWHGFAQALIYAYGMTLDEFTKIDHYGAAPWHPGPSMLITPPPTPPRAVTPANDRVARDLELAQKVFCGDQDAAGNAGVGSAVEGTVADDFADGWLLFSPWLGEVAPRDTADCAAVVTAAHRKTRERLADYARDQFEAWPTDDGCAARWRVGGHAADGAHYEYWEQLFLDTDHDGRIARLEFYGDWQGFPQTLGYVTGLSIDELWDADDYRNWIAS